MKTGMNLLLWTTHVTDALFPLLAKLKATGYDGVEIPLFEGDVDHYKRLGDIIARNGLGVTTVSVLGTGHNPLSPDKAEQKAAVARALGCDEVVVVSREEFVARVRELTGGEGVPVVYDSIGRETLLRSFECLRPRGTVVL